MRFCSCGKMLEETPYGYICICGLRYGKDGKPIDEDGISETMRIENRKRYRYKYPNMNDPVVRVVEPVPESESADEMFSSTPPSEKGKSKKGFFFGKKNT